MTNFSENLVNNANKIGSDVMKDERAMRRKFKKNLTKSGLEYLLGQVQRDALNEASSERLSSAQLKELGLSKIPSPRRSEALWFFDNFTDIQDFIKDKGFAGSNVSALQKKVRKTTLELNKPEKQEKKAPEIQEKIAMQTLIAQTKEILAFNDYTVEQFLDALIEASEKPKLPIKMVA